MSINIEQAKSYCCEDISLIENYKEAVNDSQTWVCHHRLGIELNKNWKELEAMGLYWNRPACELMFLEDSKHKSLHAEKRWESQEERDKQSKKMKGKTLTEEQHRNISIAAKKRYENQEERDKASNRAKKLWESQEYREKQLEKMKGKTQTKYKWQTPDGEIKIMDKANAHRHHSDWTLIK